MPDLAEVNTILNTLIENTQQGKVKWKVDTDLGDDQFFATFGRFLYTLGSRDFDGKPPWEFQIWRLMKTEADPDAQNIRVLEVVNVDEFSRIRLGDLSEAIRRSLAGLQGSLLDAVLEDLNGESSTS